MSELIKLEKPYKDFAYSKMSWDKAMESKDFLEIHAAKQKTESPAYLHWMDLKRKSWLPKDLTAIEFWSYVKYSRFIKSQPLQIKDKDGDFYHWIKIPDYDRTLHEIDMDMGGRFFGTSGINEHERYRFISHSLMEEAIASAQLEGAHTTREQAARMIRENRPPVDNSQRMIYNNYRAMQAIEAETKNKPMDMTVLLDLHMLLTHDTMSMSDQAGRLRRDDENIVVEGPDGMVAHIPPDIEFVKQELPRLFDWANDINAEKDPFIHPLIKAICLHFWIGYLHPFTDGNGRLARAIFYWYLLRKDYWAFAFIPISTRIKKSPSQYGWAYIYSEQDDKDLTYFIDYNLKQIQLARSDFEIFVTKTLAEKNEIGGLSRKFPTLNDRQLQLVQHLKKHSSDRANVTSIRNVYGVTAATAVKDLKGLLEIGLLFSQRQGRNVFYYPTDKLTDL